MIIDKNSPIPLYLQMKSLLETNIRSGKLPINSSLPSERELCRLHGVSVITARQALKELEILGLVMRVPGKGTFVADYTISTPSAVKTVGFIVDNAIGELENYYMMQLMGGIKAEVRREHTNFMLFFESEKSYLALAEAGQLHGVIISNPKLNPIITQTLNKYNVPVVVIGHPSSRSSFSVDSDNVAVGYQLTAHLLEAGFRKIGFIGFEADLPVIKDRIAGYKAAMHELFIAVKHNWVRCASYSRVLGASEALELKADGVDAIVCADDLIAMNAGQSLAAGGGDSEVPIALVGCNNSILARYAKPALTSVELFPEIIGIHAAQKLLALMCGETKVEKHTLVDFELHKRESSRNPRITEAKGV